ncbi:MAG: hypothetical protein ACTSVU_05885 [Promethearchaeota archaeon]
MDAPQSADKDTFLKLMLKTRPEYAIIWDVHGKEVQEIHNRVWVTQYVVISGNNVYYSQSRHYADRAKTLFNLKQIVFVESEEKWEDYLPAGERFKTIRYYAPDIVSIPTEIALEDFITKMLRIRPLYCVIWGITTKELETIVSRVYVSSFMLVIDDTLYYSFGKQFAVHMQKKFRIPKHKLISIQNPPLFTD